MNYLGTLFLEVWVSTSEGKRKGCTLRMAAWVGEVGAVRMNQGSTDATSGLCSQVTPGLGSGPCCAWGTGWKKFGTDGGLS